MPLFAMASVTSMPVTEDDALDHLAHLIFALQPPLGLRGGHAELEDYQRGGSCEKAPLVRTVQYRTVATTLEIGCVVSTRS